jgi:hypothetical protein
MRPTVLGLDRVWLILICALVLIASGVGLYAKGRSVGREIERHSMQAKVDQANAHAEKASQAARDARDKVDEVYAQSKVALDLKYRSTNLPAIRLCDFPASRIEVSRDPDGTGRDHAAAEANGLPRDIAPDLKQFARDADEQTQQLMACQAFVRSLPR